MINPMNIEHFQAFELSQKSIQLLRQVILHLLVSGKFRRPKTNESEEFTNKDSWQSRRLSELVQLVNGRVFKSTEWKTSGLPIVRIQNLNNKDAEFNYCDPTDLDSKHRIETGTLLISWSGTPGTSFGAFIWERGSAALNQHIFKCTPTNHNIELRFLQLAVNSQLETIIANANGGVGLQHITKNKLEDLEIFFPSLLEQREIIETYLETYELLHSLEQSIQEKNDGIESFFKSLIERINKERIASKSQKFKNLNAVLKIIEGSTTNIKHIEYFRQIFRDMAVRGYFSANAKKLFKSIAIQDVASLQNGYAFKSEWFSNSGTRLLRNINITPHSTRWSDTAHISNDRAAEYQRFLLNENDIILSLDRPFISTGTKSAKILPTDLPCLLVQRVGRFVMKNDDMTADFLLLWTHSTDFFNQVTPGRSSGVPHISARQVEESIISKPSTDEQVKITKKIQEISFACDELEREISARNSLHDEYLNCISNIYLNNGRQFIPTPSAPETNSTRISASTSKEPMFMKDQPITTLEQLLLCLEHLGGETSPDVLIAHSGLSDNIELFFDLLRQGRSEGSLVIPLGQNAISHRKD